MPVSVSNARPFKIISPSLLIALLLNACKTAQYQINLHGYAILPNPGMLRGIVPDRIELSSKVSLPISGQTFTGLSYQNWRVRAKKTRVCAKFVLEKEILINFIAQIVLHPTEVWSLSTICNDVHGVTET